MDDATCTFGLAVIKGGDVTRSRGVHPAAFVLTTEARPAFSAYVGPLQLDYGNVHLSFPDCALAPHGTNIWQNREALTWTMLVVDRRWSWQYARINGEYNRRKSDGTIDPDTRKSLPQLLDLLLSELGETGIYSQLPDVHPHVNWQNAFAARELEWLCERGGLAICPEMEQKQTRIEPIGYGIQLPSPAVSFNVTPWLRYQQAVMPDTVEVHCGPTVIQKLLSIGEAVGLDEDGSIRPLNSLTYTPTEGWASQWFTTFQGVDEELRHLAFRSVWRWYRFDVADLETYRILQQLAESVDDSLGIPRTMDCVVKGTFWPQSDLKINVDDQKYPGTFRIRPDLHLIEFEHPVIQWSGDEVAPAELSIYITYTRVNSIGGEQRATFAKAVPGAIGATEPRVERREHLRLVEIQDAAFGQASTNAGEIVVESQAYLNAIVRNYFDDQNGRPEEVDMLYGGIVPIELSGQIAQVRFRWGNDRVPTTRGSQNHEFDNSSLTFQERRRRSRLAQIADRILE